MPNKGYKHTAENRKKLSLAKIGNKNRAGKIPWNKGKTTSLETRQKISETLRGSTPWNKDKRGCQVAWNKGLKGVHNSPESEFKVGATPWNKGKTNVYSKEVLKRMSEASIGNKSHLGHKHSIESRKKMSIALTGTHAGPLSSNWKGGITTANKLGRTSAKYKAWQSAVFHKDNYTCQVCESYGEYVHADHIKSWAEHPELRYDVDNGRTLCRACHYYITFKRKMPATSNWGLARKR